MAGKLKIVRILTNPRRKAKKKKAARRSAPRSRKTPRLARKSLSNEFVVRIITHARTALWLTGNGWSKSRKDAARFKTAAAGAAALKKTGQKPSGWIVADVLAA